MNELQSNSIALFAATREKALARLAEFSRTASRYSRDRNYVVPNHTNVSRLSPAIRHRLVSEQEAAQVVLGRYAFSTVEKFLQEIYWRRYWKSWLSMLGCGSPHIGFILSDFLGNWGRIFSIVIC